MYTIESHKSGLSAWNDKRVIYKDEENNKFYTIPLGHYLSFSNLSDEEIITKLKSILPSDEKNYINPKKRCNTDNDLTVKSKYLKV